MRGLSGKTVIVTGGGGGIGGATCQRFAAEGANVAVFDVDAAAAERTVAAITSDGGKAAAFACDITNHEGGAIRSFRGERVARADRCARQQCRMGHLQAVSQDIAVDWQKLIAINLTGAFIMHHAVLPQMVERRSGRVVNIASDAARVGSSGEAVYAACKGGLVAFSKTMAREHARDGITFNVVCPGPTDTQLLGDFVTAAGNPEKLKEAFRRSIPLGRIGAPAYLISRCDLFLRQRGRRVHHRPGTDVSGGLTMAG